MITEIEIDNNDFLIDFIIKNSPDVGRFKFDNVFDGLKASQVDTVKLLQRRNTIRAIMLNQLKYIEIDKDLNLNVILSDKGREVKNAGGHLAYLDKIAAKELADKESQSRKETIEKTEVKHKTWTYKKRYLPFLFPALAFIISVIAVSISIKALKNNKVPQDLEQMKETLQTLKEKMNRQDSLFRLDTHQIKHKQ